MQLIVVLFTQIQSPRRPAPLLPGPHLRIAQQYHQATLCFECVPQLGEAVLLPDNLGGSMHFQVVQVQHLPSETPQSFRTSLQPRLMILLQPVLPLLDGQKSET